MKIKYLLFLLIAFPFVVNSQSQKAVMNHLIREGALNLQHTAYSSFSPEELKQIMENSYFNKEFVDGKLFYNNIESENNYLLRYNAFIDEIESQSENGIEYVIRHSQINCLLGDEKYIFRQFKSNEKEPAVTGYLKVIYEGENFSIFAREFKEYKEEQKAKTSLATSWPARLVDNTEFYFLEKSGNYAFRIYNKKKMFSKNVSENVLSDAAKFIKKNRLTIKNKDDLITIYRYYNSLLTKNSEI